MIRVLVADDEAMVRAGLLAILATADDIDVVAEASDGDEAVRLTASHRPHVVLLDVQMPRKDGLTALRELGQVAPRTAVIVLTTFGNRDNVRRALGDGADGFLLKASDPRELLLGIRAVASGAAYLSPKVASYVIDDLRDRHLPARDAARHDLERLSDREREVLVLLGTGYANAEIADRLHVVESTVKTYVSSIFHQLSVRNRVQAALIAYQAGIVPLEDSASATAPRE